MNPAPGYDAFMPHDLLHFVVERELGLTQGIFGQVAAGGTARTFHASAQGVGRAHARTRRRARARGESLAREGSESAAQSERSTYICLYEWLRRSTDVARRHRAQDFKDDVSGMRSAMPTHEAKALNAAMIDRICAALDGTSRQWTELGDGQSFTLVWPEGRRHAGRR